MATIYSPMHTDSLVN